MNKFSPLNASIICHCSNYHGNYSTGGGGGGSFIVSICQFHLETEIRILHTIRINSCIKLRYYHWETNNDMDDDKAGVMIFKKIAVLKVGTVILMVMMIIMMIRATVLKEVLQITISM